MTKFRLSNFLLRSLAVTLTVLLLWIYFSSNASIFSAVAFLLLRNSDHVVVSVFIEFPLISCYLKLLYKLKKKQICMIVVPSLAVSPEPLAHSRDVASLSLFYRCHFGRSSSELAQLVPLPHSRGWSICQWCNLTLAQQFWTTKVCLRTRKMSKICLFVCPTRRATSSKENFENHSRYSLVKSYQFLSI